MFYNFTRFTINANSRVFVILRRILQLQLVPPKDLREEILSNAMEIDPEVGDNSGKNKSKEKDEKPSFGVRLDTKKILNSTLKKNWSDCPLS